MNLTDEADFKYLYFDIWTFENFNFTREPLGRVIFALRNDHYPIDRSIYDIATDGTYMSFGDIRTFDGTSNVSSLHEAGLSYPAFISDDAGGFERPYVVGALPDEHKAFGSQLCFTIDPATHLRDSALEVGEVFDYESISVLERMKFHPPIYDAASPYAVIAKGLFVKESGELHPKFSKWLRDIHKGQVKTEIDYDRKYRTWSPIPKVKSMNELWQQFIRQLSDKDRTDDIILIDSVNSPFPSPSLPALPQYRSPLSTLAPRPQGNHAMPTHEWEQLKKTTSLGKRLRQFPTRANVNPSPYAQQKLHDKQYFDHFTQQFSNRIRKS